MLLLEYKLVDPRIVRSSDDDDADVVEVGAEEAEVGAGEGCVVAWEVSETVNEGFKDGDCAVEEMGTGVGDGTLETCAISLPGGRVK